jgi:hypothetical protein
MCPFRGSGASVLPIAARLALSRFCVLRMGRFSIDLMWLGGCLALVVDLSFPLLPCKSFSVPLRILLFRCFNAGMEIYGYVYHADILEKCSLVLYCQDLTKDFGSRSKSVLCSLWMMPIRQK